MIVTIDKGHYYEIYSDNDKKIKEKDILWNATKEEPIAVDKTRFAKGDYVESDVEIEPIEEIIIEDEEVEDGEEKGD